MRMFSGLIKCMELVYEWQWLYELGFTLAAARDAEQRHDAYHHHRAQNRKAITTPVGYYRENVNLWVLTSRDRTWWKNLKGGAEVSFVNVLYITIKRS